MRIRILQKPEQASIDGIRLDRFQPGGVYDVGNALGELLLAEGWGEPVPLDDPAVFGPLGAKGPVPRTYRPRGRSTT
jgi:hypothetical protein